MRRFNPSSFGCRNAFTLVELLVVMGIIALLLAVVLPAVRGLGGASSRRGAVDTLLGALDRARTMALSDGLSTYVVFATPSGDGKKLKPDLWGRSYAIYEDHDNLSFSPEQKTPWILLPVSLAFKVNKSGVNNDGAQYDSVLTRVLIPAGQSNSDPAFPVSASGLPAGTAATSLQLPYWKFDGTGAVDEQAAAYLRVLIFPGYIDPASGAENFTQKMTGGGSAQNALLLEEIDVNAATGRARYIVNPAYNMATPAS